MPSIREILCPVDFSDTSRHAVEHAATLARWYRARITALFVYTPIYVPLPGAVPMPAMAGPDAAEMARLKADLVAALAPAASTGVQVDTVVREGAPAVDILDAAQALPADLIVMGTHGAGGFERLVLGSVTERVLRKSTCPVLTVPPRVESAARLPFRSILCAVDFSPSAEVALKYARSLAAEGQAHLTLVHVLDWPEEEPVSYRAFDIPEYKRLVAHDVKVRLEAMVPPGERAAGPFEIRLAHGKAYREIVSMARAVSADLIVMGAGGAHPFEFLFGSTASQVVRTAACPVLTVRR